MNFAKLKRKAALSWYSPGGADCAQPEGTPANENSAAKMSATDRRRARRMLRGRVLRPRSSKPRRASLAGFNARDSFIRIAT